MDQEHIADIAFQARRMYPKFMRDPEFYTAKQYLRKCLPKHVIMFHGNTVYVYFGNERVVV